MMKKGLLSFCLLLGALTALAQVSVISVTDEDKHSKKSDFSHTFEYFVFANSAESSPTVSAGKCQATRIGRRWFATAAHCVQEICKNGCTIQLDLVEGNVSALAQVTHTPQKPAVFIHPDFSSNIFVKNDFALFRLDLDRTPFIYYRRDTKDRKNRIGLTQQEFDQIVAKSPRLRSALYHIKSPTFPPILMFDAGNYVLDRTISVISIFDGVRSVKKDPHAVHYIKALELAYTDNFGIRHGMSGSGVMSNTGELLGIISGIFQVSNVAVGAKETPQLQNEWFMFFAFNQSAVNFMQSVMGSDFNKLDFKDAYPYAVHKSRQKYTDIIDRMEKFYKQKQKPNSPAKSHTKSSAK